MKTLIVAIIILCSQNSFANYYEEVNALKATIVEHAKKYEGMGDPDYKIQKELEPLVTQLLLLNPQPNIQERLPILAGVWKQVWGPYEYRNNKRDVDPSLDVNEIYQVLSPEGFYYNVSPNLDKKTRKEKNINYLRGQYTLSKTDPIGLDVKFIKFIGMKNRPTEKAIYDYADEAERDQLPTQITVVPAFLVKLFFGGGTLREVYTDQDIRILYGSNGSEFKNQYLYVMTRAK